MPMHPREIRFYVTLMVLCVGGVACLLLQPFVPEFGDAEHLAWLLGKLPYLVLPVAGILGLRLNLTRAFLTALVWTLCYVAARYWPAAGFAGITPAELRAVISIALPVATILLVVLGEGRALGPHGLLQALSVLVPFGLLLWGAHADLKAVTGFLFFSLPGQSLWRIPLAAPLIVAAGAVLVVFRADHPVRFFAHASLASFVVLLVALNRRPADSVHDGFGLGLSVCAALLVYSVYCTYWEKVYVDDLTGILNRRALNERLYRLGRHYSVAMLDIDYFKAFNDTHGHAQGDTVLRFVAAHLDRSFTGHAFRYGGEEFCVLFDHMPLRVAARRVEAVRHLVHSRDFYIRMPEPAREHTTQDDRGGRVGGKIRVHINFSAGVAYRDMVDERPEDVIDMADTALYSAKRAGRGRVVCYGEQGV